MITGYNTDVRHGELVFHVQTEDKGAGNPFIETLVYVGGQVLASKRASYATLLAEGKDEKSIVALMDHQHRTMIAAIRHGKFNEKLTDLLTDRQAAPSPTGSQPVAPVAPVVPVAPPAAAVPASADVTRNATTGVRQIPRAPERTLDQVILEYLTSEADQEQLLLVLEGESELALGQRAEVALRATSSKSGRPIEGAQVAVKMISTVAEPRSLAAGRTDAAGGARLLFDIPQLGRGTAALIITAVSAIGRAELKHLL